jgi:hypothetical protein
MPSVSQLRAAIEATVSANIDGLHVYATVPEAANLPALIVRPSAADFQVAMGRGADKWEFDLYVLCPSTIAQIAQDDLDELVTGAGARSLRQVIFQNRTLGLANTEAYVTNMTDYGGQFEAAGVEHIGAVLKLVAYTTGTA